MSSSVFRNILLNVDISTTHEFPVNMGLTSHRVRGTLVSMSEILDPSSIVDVTALVPACTQDEETFALAVIEANGNIASAYRMAFGDDLYPLARGKQFLCRPQVALKIKELTDAIQDASLISVGAHLHELADIRDLAKGTGQLKTALAAERARGEAVGIYQKHDAQNKGKGTGSVNIQINMASKHDVNI
jgi:hypothetical protein